MWPGYPPSHPEGACARSDHSAGALTHHAALQIASLADRGIPQMASEGHCGALCEHTTTEKSNGEKPWAVSPLHNLKLNNHQQMCSKGDGEFQSSKYMFSCFRNFFNNRKASSHMINKNRKASSSMTNNSVPTLQHLNPASSSSCNFAVGQSNPLLLKLLSSSCNSAVGQSNPLLLKLLKDKVATRREGQQGNALSQPPGQQGNTLSQPPGQQGNALSQPPGQQGNTLSQPPAQQGNTLSQPPAQQGNALSQPPGQQGNALSQPPGQQGKALSQPPGQQGNALSQPPGKNMLPQVSTENPNCTFTNAVAALPRQGSDLVPETQYGPSPSFRSLLEKSTENNSALGKNVLTDGQLMVYIKQRVQYLKTQKEEEEDGTKEDSANTLLTRRIQGSDNCAKSTVGKCWESGTPIPAEENSRPHAVKSADQKSSSLGFVSLVKEPSDVIVSLDCNNQVIDSNNCHKACDISEDESYNSDCCEKTSKNVLFTVPTLLYTSVALKELVASVENAEAPVVPRDNLRDFIIKHYWNGDIRKLCVFITTECPKILMDVAATCTKNEDESPVVLSAITGMAFDELVEKFPTLTTLTNYTPSQDEYKSFWLNINEHVDDLDKEPGVACCFSLEKAKEDVGLKAADTAGTSDSIPDETDTVFPAGRRQADKETVAEESPAGNLSPVKISVLSSKKAKEIFDLYQNKSNHQLMFLTAPHSEENCEERARLPENQKEQLTEFPSLIKDPKYDDITDEDLPKYEDITDVESLKYEDITDEESETTDQQNEAGASLSVNYGQKQSLPCRNQDNEQRQAITEMTSNNQELRKMETDALKQTCCCPYLVETEDGFEKRLCPTCETKPEFRMKTSYISSAVFKELSGNPVSSPVSGASYPLSDDGITLNRDAGKAPNFSQTDAKETSQHESSAKTEASLEELGLEYEDPQCERFIDVEHEELSVDESSLHKETSVTGDKDVPYIDETEEEDNDDDGDWMVIPVAVSDLTFEPTDGDCVWPEDDLPQGVENGEKQEDDVMIVPLCEAQDSTLRPAVASPSSDIEVFESQDGFLKANNIDYSHIFTFPEEDDIQTRDQNLRPQIISCETESETEQRKRQASTSETEHSSDYSIASPKNYLTVSKKCLKKRLRPNGSKGFSESDSEDEEGDNMSNVSQSRPLPDPDSEDEDDECTNNVHKRRKRRLSTTTESEDSSVKSDSEDEEGDNMSNVSQSRLLPDPDSEDEDDECTNNVHKRRKRRLSTTTESEDSSVKSDSEDEEGDNMSNVSQSPPLPDSESESEDCSVESPCMVTSRQSAEPKTETNVIQCRSKGAKTLNGKHTATDQSNSRPEQHSKNTCRTKRKRTHTASQDDSTATVLVEDRCRDERSPQRARLSSERQTGDGSDGSTVQQHHHMDDERQRTPAPLVVPCVLKQASPGLANSVKPSKESAVHKQTAEKKKHKRSKTQENQMTESTPSERSNPLSQRKGSHGGGELGNTSYSETRERVHKVKEGSKEKKGKRREETRERWTEGRVDSERGEKLNGENKKERREGMKETKERRQLQDERKKDNKQRKNENRVSKVPTKTTECGAHGRQISTSRDCPSTLEQVLWSPVGSLGFCRVGLSNSTEGSPSVQGISAPATARKQMSTSMKCPSTLKPVPSPSRDCLSNSTEGSSSVKDISARATARKQMSMSMKCPSTLKQVLSPSRECLSNSTEGSPSIEDISARATARKQMSTSRERLSTLKPVPSPSIKCLPTSRQGSSSMEYLSRSRESKSRSSDYVSVSREGPSTSGEGTTSSRKHVTKSRKGSPSSRKHSSESEEGLSTSGKALSSARRSREHLSFSRHNLSREGMSTSKEGSKSSFPPISNPREGSSSLTSGHTPATRRQLVNSLWESTYYPTRRDRRTSCGEEVLKTSPTHSKDSHRDAEREARRKRRPSQESVPLLMKRSRNEAKLWTKARCLEGPTERRRSVGNGYKWKDGRQSVETKGTSRERTELGSSPEQCY